MWLSDHGTLTYVPEPGFAAGLFTALTLIAIVYWMGPRND